MVEGRLRLVVARRELWVGCTDEQIEVAGDGLPVGLSIEAETWLSRAFQLVAGRDLQLGMSAVDHALHIDGEQDALLAVLEDGVPDRIAELARRCRMKLEDRRITARVRSEEDAREVVALAIDLCDPGEEPRDSLVRTMTWSGSAALRWAAWRRLKGLAPDEASRRLPDVMQDVVRSGDTRLIRELMGYVAQTDDPAEITALVQAFPTAGPAWIRAVFKLLLSERALGRMVDSLSTMEHEQRVAALAAVGSMAEEELIPRLVAWAETVIGLEYASFVQAAIQQIEARASGAGGELTLVDDAAADGRLSVAGDPGGLAMAEEVGGLTEVE